MQIFNNFQFRNYNNQALSFKGKTENTPQSNPNESVSKQHNDPDFTLDPKAYMEMFASSPMFDKAVDLGNYLAGKYDLGFNNGEENGEENGEADISDNQANMAAEMFLGTLKVANDAIAGNLTEEELAQFDEAPMLLTLDADALIEKQMEASKLIEDEDALNVTREGLASVVEKITETMGEDAETNEDNQIDFQSDFASNLSEVIEGLSEEGGGILGEILGMRAELANCLKENHYDDLKALLDETAKLRSLISLKAIQVAKTGNARQAIDLLTNDGFIASTPTSIIDNKDGTATYEYINFLGSKLSIVRNYNNGDYVSFSLSDLSGIEQIGADFREDGSIAELRMQDINDGSKSIIKTNNEDDKIKVTQSYENYYIQRELAQNTQGIYKLTKRPTIVIKQ